MHTAFVQVSFKEDHKSRQLRIHGADAPALGRAKCRRSTAYFQSGGLVERCSEYGLCPRPSTCRSPAPIWSGATSTASRLAQRSAGMPGVAELYIPQDLDYPALQLDVDRIRAGQLGLDQREVVNNVITALTSNGMIAPTFWIDPKSGIRLHAHRPVQGEADSKPRATCTAIPVRGAAPEDSTRLDAVSNHAPHPVAHRGGPLPTPPRHRRLCEALRRGPRPDRHAIDEIVARHQAAGRNDWSRCAAWCRACGRRSAVSPPASLLAVVLLYLILVAQFRRSSIRSSSCSRCRRECWSADHPGRYRHYSQRHVADGRGHAGRHRSLEQHPDRRIHPPLAGRGHGRPLGRGLSPAASDCARC